MVTLSGVGLCLKASSKLSHLHRRIVKAATSMHARITFETGNMQQIQTDKNDTNSILERLNNFCRIQDECCRRAALGKQIENLTVLIYFVFLTEYTHSHSVFRQKILRIFSLLFGEFPKNPSKI